MRILLRSGIDASPAEARMLTARLAAHGLSLDQLSTSDIVTAVILQRNNVGLDPTLLTGASDGRMAMDSLAALTGMVETLLNGQELPPDIRAVLQAFKADAHALFSTLLSGITVADGTADTFLSVLVQDISADVRSLLDTIPVDVRSRVLDAITALNGLVSGDAHAAEAAHSGLAQTLGEIRAALPSLLAGAEQENMTALLSNFAGELEAMLQQAGVQPPAGHMGTLVQRYFERLISMLDMRDGDEDVAGLLHSENGIVGLPLKKLAVSSGMHFEWRLLAWHRAGGDPRELRSLMHRDLKGLVTMLMANLRERLPASGDDGDTIADLVRMARDVHRAVSREQLANLRHDPGEVGRAHFSVTLSPETPHEHARIAIRSQVSENSTESGGRGPFTIDLDMQLDRLGHVIARLSVHRLSMNVTFLLENDALADEARERQEELVQMLGDRGFHVKTVTCTVMQRNGTQVYPPDSLDMTV